MITPRQHSDFVLYRRLLLEAKPFWANMAGLFVLSLLGTPLTLLNPLPLKLVVDSVLGSQALPGWFAAILPAGTQNSATLVVALIAGFLVVIALLKQVLDLAFALLRSYTGERLVLAFRAKLFRHTQGLSLSYHDSIGTADSTYRIQYDAPAIQWITIDAFIPLVSSLFTLVAMIAVMLRIDWVLALVALTVVPVLYVVSQIYSRRLKLRWREAKDLESSTLSVVQEVLSSMRVVKAFAAEDREHERYVTSAGKNLRQQIKLALTSGSFGLIIGVAMAMGTAIVLFLATRHVQAGTITLGDLILVMSYLALLYSPLQTLSKSAASLQGSLVSAERSFQLLDEAPGVVEKPHAVALARARGAVEFANVSFGYDAERLALHDISFEIAAGSRVGIAGTTGAGKSTLVSLLLRFYDPTGGGVSLDGVDLRDFKLRDLRNQFAIVLQEPVLFSGSIAENIAYAKPDAHETEIVAAAQSANAHDFISRLPQGYKTEVGERGVQLSGGERQRISLARAFLKDAPILILDEPTSSVDVKTEAVIMEAMMRLMRGRTTFMIAHRLSTLDVCDVRIQLEHGRIVSFTGGIAQRVNVGVA
ncbi:MAG: ABC transporter ATP-binding protein [Opitutaceae bacterium]